MRCLLIYVYATHLSRGGAADIITWKVESSGDIFFSYILNSKHIPCHTVPAWPALTHDQGQWGSSQAKHVALTAWCFESNEHGRCCIVHVFTTGDLIIPWSAQCSPTYDPSSHQKVFLKPWDLDRKTSLATGSLGDQKHFTSNLTKCSLAYGNLMIRCFHTLAYGACLEV